jgi:hypothetical protein
MIVEGQCCPTLHRAADRELKSLGQTLIVLNLALAPTAGRLLHCGIAIPSMTAAGH